MSFNEILEQKQHSYLCSVFCCWLIGGMTVYLGQFVTKFIIHKDRWKERPLTLCHPSYNDNKFSVKLLKNRCLDSRNGLPQETTTNIFHMNRRQSDVKLWWLRDISLFLSEVFTFSKQTTHKVKSEPAGGKAGGQKQSLSVVLSVAVSWHLAHWASTLNTELEWRTLLTSCTAWDWEPELMSTSQRRM